MIFEIHYFEIFKKLEENNERNQIIRPNFKTPNLINNEEIILIKSKKTLLMNFLKEELYNNDIIIEMLSDFNEIFKKNENINENLTQNELKLIFINIKTEINTIKELLFDFIIFFYRDLFKAAYIYCKHLSPPFNVLYILLDDLIFSNKNSFYFISMKIINKITEERKKLLQIQILKEITDQKFDIYDLPDIFRILIDKNKNFDFINCLKSLSLVLSPRKKFETIGLIKEKIIQKIKCLSVDGDQIISIFCVIICENKEKKIFDELVFVEEFLHEKFMENNENLYFYNAFKAAIQYLILKANRNSNSLILSLSSENNTIRII